jgi:hypothetical protein
VDRREIRRDTGRCFRSDQVPSPLQYAHSAAGHLPQHRLLHAYPRVDDDGALGSQFGAGVGRECGIGPHSDDEDRIEGPREGLVVLGGGDGERTGIDAGFMTNGPITNSPVCDVPESPIRRFWGMALLRMNDAM